MTKAALEIGSLFYMGVCIKKQAAAFRVVQPFLHLNKLNSGFIFK